MFHLWVPFWNYWAQQTSYIVILCTTKILFLPRSWNVRFHACFDRDMFRSKYARRVRPWSLSMLCRWRHWGRGMYLLPLQRHTHETSLRTWLPMPGIVCVSNANSLHYYVLRVPRNADMWRLFGLYSIHAPLRQITLRRGIVCMHLCTKRNKARVTVCVIVL